ncbi:WG repeat-containing protein [Micromonospora sp. WMMC273]|uniref:WG repeat-containing protein n=1 Tax=Micromonospora sp. WMMC273 TaxID=3015157 RepID=UPI0022B6135A|nr:WG repeat-containing protein [Micromonospora sp. WMMC273]MCZ7476723.1 WG repeat-containing protein [Micromonospora sp. WMMC273]
MPAPITPPPAEPTTADTSVPAPDGPPAEPEPHDAIATAPEQSSPPPERNPNDVATSGTTEARQDGAAPETTADETTRETIADRTAQEPAAADGTGHSPPTPSTPEPVATAADADATAAALPQQAQAQAEDTEPTPAGTEHDAEHAGSAEHTNGDDEGDAQDPRTPEVGAHDGAEPAADAEPAVDAEPPPSVDPEQALAAVGWELDPLTLRERAPDPAHLRVIRDGLTGKLDTTLDNRSRARLLSLRAVASRILGDLDDALGDARLAVTYAEATGEFRRTALARARLAEALRWRGDHAEADRLFAEANSPELPDRLRALLHEHAGRCCFDQGRLTEACLHFERALDLRHGEDAQLNARVEVALDAVATRAAADGFGPAPRRPEEVLGTPRPPMPTFDEEQELWGYADADGEMVIAHRYAEAQPFHEGLAWVRRPEASRWALIDPSGAALIEANNGYRAVVPFSDGLSWVSMDGKSRWMAVDRMNIVKIPPGYEEARPFRNGLAAVRQNGGWGAVDLTGEVVVPTRYHRLGTPLADGREVDGFTADGLAVVELAGRRGVVDRTGRVVVPPAYPTVVVHPVAFLVAAESGRWGALDRRGEPLIDPVHPGRTAVVVEIDRLLADASPVL